MRVFFYDGSFEGVLCALFDAYTLKRFPDRLLLRGEIPPLNTEETHVVETEQGRAERVFRGLERRLSAFALSGLLYAALADDAPYGSLLFRYMRKVFDTPGSLEGTVADPDVPAVERLATQVGREKQHLTGFARFQKTARDVYVALLQPRYNVLPLLVGHFQDRFADRQWLLYDLRRGYGIFYDRTNCRKARLEEGSLKAGRLDPALLAGGEEFLTRLWQGYHQAACIRERMNPALQRRCMPRRFWPLLPEKA